MNIARIFATVRRILQQLKRDLRTIALILAVPLIMIAVLRFVFDERIAVFENFAPLLVGIMTFIVMFVVSAVATLRERRSGTLERLLVLPTNKLEIILGYAIAFGSISLIQSSLVTGLVVGVFSVPVEAPATWLMLLGVMSGLSGMSFGLLFSNFARNEFQAVQFMPAFVLPQIIVCGLFIPREDMVEPLYIVSGFLPIAHAVEATNEIIASSSWTTALSANLGLLAILSLASLILASLSMRSSV